MARRFAREGFAVALLSRTEEKLLPVEEAIKREGGHAISVLCDAGTHKVYAYYWLLLIYLCMCAWHL